LEPPRFPKLFYCSQECKRGMGHTPHDQPAKSTFATISDKKSKPRWQWVAVKRRQ
jgi:hypothetical protein